MVNKNSFVVKTKSGKELKLAVEKPDMVRISDGQIEYYKAWNRAEKAEAPFRFQVEKILRRRGEWSDKKSETEQELIKRIRASELALAKGGLKLSAAKDIAFKIMDLRNELFQLNEAKRSLEQDTVEAQAEAARFSYFVFACTVYDDEGTRYFAELKDYLEPSEEDTPVAAEAAKQFGMLQYGLNPNYTHTLPENKFLLRYKMAKVVNGNVHLMDAAGRLISRDGKLIDENGRFIDVEGNYVDREGNRIDLDTGEYMPADAQPFVDDVTGEPVVVN